MMIAAMTAVASECDLDDVAEGECEAGGEDAGGGGEAEADVDEADVFDEPVGGEDGGDEGGEGGVANPGHPSARRDWRSRRTSAHASCAFPTGERAS